MQNRIKTLLEFLKEGKAFTIEGLRIGIENNDLVFVTGWTQYHYIENLTKLIALKEVEEIKKIFQDIVNISNEIQEYLKNKTVEYKLAIQAGQSSMGICSEKNGIIIWYIELK